jgi:hypothetical protein
MHATTQELWEAVFSVGSVQRQYLENQNQQRVNLRKEILGLIGNHGWSSTVFSQQLGSAVFGPKRA